MRSYRVVRWCEQGRTRFVVVSLNPLDRDPTWDAIAAFNRQDRACRYLDDLRDRIELLETQGLA